MLTYAYICMAFFSGNPDVVAVLLVLVMQRPGLLL